MERTLYLSESPGTTVLRDGPSILIKREGGAESRIPLRFIGRVVVMGRVFIDSGVMTLFAGSSVPVLFIDRSSGERAVSVPCGRSLPASYREQKAFVESRTMAERCLRWLEARRALIRHKVLKRLIGNVPRAGVGEGNYEEVLRRLKPTFDKWKTAKGMVEGLFFSLVTEHVLRAGLDPHLGVKNRRHNYGLVLDLCYTFEPEADLQCIQFFRNADERSLIEKSEGRWVVSGRGMRDMAHRFEMRRAEICNSIDSAIDELFELMRGRAG